MVDAITAIKQHYATLSAEGKQNLLKQFGVSDIHGLVLISPEVAEKYCKTHHINLGEVSVWKDQGNDWMEQNYLRAKGDWNEAYAALQATKKSAGENKRLIAQTEAQIKQQGASASNSLYAKLDNANKTRQTLDSLENQYIDSMRGAVSRQYKSISYTT